MSKTIFSLLLMPLLASGVNAELRPISDQQMSEVTGQAFVSVDRQYHPDANDNTAYTRVNLGMDIDIQTNVDVLEMGRYERDGEQPAPRMSISRILPLAISTIRPTLTPTPKLRNSESPMAASMPRMR